MKKIVFALQVFGLIAATPLIVVLEMNHQTKSFPATNISAAIPANSKITVELLPGNDKEEFTPAVLPVILIIDYN